MRGVLKGVNPGCRGDGEISKVGECYRVSTIFSNIYSVMSETH